MNFSHRNLTRSLIVLTCLVWLSTTPVRAAAQQGGGNNDASGPTIHVVQAGETLDSIAAKYNITPALIEQANSITDPSEIQVGTRLIIPQSANAKASTTQSEIVLGLGDSIDVLAAEHGISSRTLAQANRIANPAVMYIGQIVHIPASQKDAGSGLRARWLGKNESLIGLAFQSNTLLTTFALRNDVADPALDVPGEMVVVTSSSTVERSMPNPWGAATLHPIPLEQGRTGGIRLALSAEGQVSGTFNGHELNFASTGNSTAAVFGIDRWTKPGLYPLSLQFTDSSGASYTLERRVLIVSGGYQREDIRLAEDVASVLNDPQLIAAENAYIAQKMSGFTPQRYWAGLFQLPTAGVLTSTFGTARLYNEGTGVNSYHTGNDFAAQVGTPIYAPADGVVVDTGQLTIHGLATIIDHGAGVYTGYWHQSSILVHPGDKVTAGQKIGTIGDTGLSTASHLHWEMWVGGVPVDSLQWVRELFP